MTKGRNLGKKTIKRKDETSDDIDANAEDNGLDAAEESGDEDKMHDTEDNGAHIKSEDVD